MPLFLMLLVFLLIGSEIYKANPVPKSKHKFIVAAHRGDHLIYPKNTLAAYQEAIKNEADYVEIDLRTTKDGQLVSMHDETINRITDGKGNVKDFTLEELGKFNVKCKDLSSKETYRIPTFNQMLDL